MAIVTQPVPRGAPGPGFALSSAVCDLSAADGRLSYRGYDVRDLAEQSTYEETVFLLLRGHLPNRIELRDFGRELKGDLKLSPAQLRAIKTAPSETDPMAVLQLSVSVLALGQGAPRGTPSAEEALRQGIRLIAGTPTIIAAFHRSRGGRKPVTPKKSLTLAANFLYMLSATVPAPESERALEIAMILRADNELNPSTFAARVTASTGADVYSCVLSALSALSGPRHGWHARNVMKVLEEIGAQEKVEDWVRQRAAGNQKIPGFGHQVYEGEDPRTAQLRALAEGACERAGLMPLYRLARALEETVGREAGQYPIVDFYLALVYRALGIHADLFTAVFAMSRMCGWIAHILEQYGDDALIRPRAEYVGEIGRKYIPIRQRRS